MSKVAVITTNPETYMEDYSRLLELIEYKKYLKKDRKTIIKLNLSWTLFFPACSTPPWQLDSVLAKMKNDGYSKLIAVENQTVVTHPWKGAYYNKWLPVLKKYKVKFVPLTDVEWCEYKPKGEMLAMDKLFRKILVPRVFINSNLVHLPTLKTHGHTTTTGAMKDAFGGLIPKYRHHAHKFIHEILVDLLLIQKDLHSALLAVMDGCVAGNGAGPRTMKPVIADILLASLDQVAIDAVAAKIMGFDPMKIKYIKIAHDKGLGNGDIKDIEIVGMEKSKLKRINLKFNVSRSPIIFFDQVFRKKIGRIKLLEQLFFHTKLFHLFILTSKIYHDFLWYPLIGKHRIKKFMKTEWGKVFDKYEYGGFPRYKEVKEWDPY